MAPVVLCALHGHTVYRGYPSFPTRGLEAVGRLRPPRIHLVTTCSDATVLTPQSSLLHQISFPSKKSPLCVFSDDSL